MSDSGFRRDRYGMVLELLPDALRRRASLLDAPGRAAAEEIRLRAGRPVSVLLPEGERPLGAEPVTVRELELLVELATGASVHAARRELARGYIACRGGFRVGLCGSVYLEGEHAAGFSAFSSANIRISRERRGIADPLLDRLCPGGRFRSTLIAAPPGAGKTTLLRETVRVLSSGTPRREAMRVSLCDERGEVAALWGGVPQLDVGERTDVLDACPKSAAVMAVLRSMGPEIIALDEITDPEDVRAVERARNCGVALLATAHAEGVEDLRSRPLYREMLSDGVFENYIFIKCTGGRREYQVIRGVGA